MFLNSSFSKAQSIFASTNGKYNQAITMTLDGQNIGIKPISCGLQHVEDKDRKTGEITKYDKIVLMLIDQNDASYIIHVNFREQPSSVGKFPAGEEKREVRLQSEKNDYNKTFFLRPHFIFDYYIKDTDKKLSYFEAFYKLKTNAGNFEITKFDLPSHRISFKIDATLENQQKKTIELKGLIINDLPFAEMIADGIGMPTKVIYQERF